jgi:formylglycine-generating enzyme required for sulfatase activity
MTPRALVVATAAAAGLVLVVARGRPASPAIWDDPVTRLRFLAVGPARFQMGTPASEHLRETQESLHPVVLAKRYYLAETAVTQAQWTPSVPAAAERGSFAGGSWAFDGGSARCGVRYILRPEDTGYSIGVLLAHDIF